MEIKKFEVAKPRPENELSEDIVKYTDNIFALSDGASISFDSRSWADFLTDKFLKNQKVNQEWIKNAVEEYNQSYTVDKKLSWAQEEAFKKGSFATLLGLVFNPTTKIATITAIGDSSAICLVKGKGCIAFPYETAEEFNRNPTLLSTVLQKNKQVKALKKEWKIKNRERDKIFLMTDALAQWTLKDKGNIKKLAELKDEGDFRHLINSEREAKNIKIDDCTLIRINFFK